MVDISCLLAQFKAENHHYCIYQCIMHTFFFPEKALKIKMHIKHQFSSNSPKIDLSSVTLSLP